MTDDKAEIRNISDTALWVACFRAMETERPDAIFRDPLVRRLAGEHGEALLETVPKAKRFAWPMIVRTAVMDEIIQRSVDEGIDTVLNLAAGLDGRPNIEIERSGHESRDHLESEPDVLDALG